MSALQKLASRGLLAALPSAGLRGDVQAPPDKSMSHRAVILGALAQGDTFIDGLLESMDVLHTVAAVRAFGADAERIGLGKWRVSGRRWRSPEGPIDCGNSGTSARLLMGAAAGQPVTATFSGDSSLSRRPMARVLAPLRGMGAHTRGLTLPVRIRGGGLGGIRHVNEHASAQVKSAILLASLGTSEEVTVVEPCPTRDHTETLLAAFGCEVHCDGREIRLGRHRALSGVELEIPGDPSSAAFPLVAALIVPGSKVRLRNVMVNPLRSGVFQTLAEMGAELKFEDCRTCGGEPVADIIASFSELKGVHVPPSRAPSMVDEYPILSIAAAFASGRTVMAGLGELRHKESDRLSAVVDGLRECGVEAHLEGDSLIVEGAGGLPGGGRQVAAHGDHRIAMSFLVMGCASRAPILVDSSHMIATSFPEFLHMMRSLGGRIE